MSADPRWSHRSSCLIPLLLLTLAGGLPGCKSREFDARQAADALSDEFSDLLDFEDATAETGAPPDTTTDEPSLLGIDGACAIAPLSLGVLGAVEYEQPFTLVLNASQVIDDGSIAGVIAHVEQANKDDQAARYLRITPPAAAFVRQQVSLQVTAHASALPLGGNAFHVSLALLRTDGQVGPFRDWNLVTYPLTGELPKIGMCACEQVTEPDPDTGYDVLVSTNLRLAPSCQDETVSGMFYGDPAMLFNADPCGEFGTMYGAQGSIYDYSFPGGTRFRPSALDSGSDPDTCWIQIDCP